MVSKTKLDLVEESFSQIKGKLVDYLTEQGIECDPGKKFLCINPEHSDKRPSMSVFMHDHGFPLIKCFSCGFVADIFTAAHVLEEKPMVGSAFLHENVKYLADKYNVEVKLPTLTEEEMYEWNTYDAYKATADFITKADYSPKCLSEVENRKWNEGFLKEYLVSCCIDYHALRQHLKNIGFMARFLDEVDLDNQKIFNQDNLIFTICDEFGRPVGFSARNLDYDPENKDKGPKFTNTKTTGLKCNIFRKSERLYLIHLAKKYISPTAPLYIVEGYGDALTLHTHGVKNASAVCGSEFTAKQLNLCRKLSINDVVICLDGDETGQTKAKQLVQEVLSSIHDIRIRFVFLPWNGKDKTDPDKFVREHGIQTFLDLPKVEPFTWMLSEFVKEIEDKQGRVTDSDSEHICKTMIPIIANEPSPLKRESMIKELSNYSGFSFQVIKEELDKLVNAEEVKVLRRKKGIIDNLKSELESRSDGFEISLEKAMQDLEYVNKESRQDKFDVDSLVSVIQGIKEYQENEELHKTVSFGPFLKTLPIALAGDIRQKMILLGGSANAGKTALFSNMSLNLAEYNEDIICINLSIDDGSRDFLSRLVTADIAARLKTKGEEDLFEALTIGKVMRPFLYKGRPEMEAIMIERDVSYKKIMKLVSDGRLGIFDATYGKSLSLVRSIIKKYKTNFPHHNIWFFIDNFHQLENADNLEGREKYRQLSNDVKQLAVLNDCTAVCTVEYTKLPTGTKPGNSNLAETRALDYDSNATMHLYSELHDIREKSKMYFTNTNGEKFPLIENYFGKNKISSFKGDIYYKFYSDKSFYEELTLEQKDELKNMNSFDDEFVSAEAKTRVSIFKGNNNG